MPQKSAVWEQRKNILLGISAPSTWKIEDIAENLSTKLDIIKKEPTGDKFHHDGFIDDARIMIGQALNDLTSLAHSSFESWQQSLLLEHTSNNVKWQLADAQLKHEVQCLEKENMEKDVMDVLMQLTSGTGPSSTSSLLLSKAD